MEDNNKPTVISNSTYDIKDKMMNVASKYFDIDDMTTLNVGLFGYITEAMSVVARDGIFHRNMMYKENFLNTASLPSSIYNIANSYGYSIPNAIGSSIRVILSLREKDIITYSKRTDNIMQLHIPRSKATLTIDNYNFILMRSVNIITTLGTNDEHVISAMYDVEENELGLRQVDYSPFITKQERRVNDEDYVDFILDFIQYERKFDSRIIMSRDISETLLFDIEYEDQLAEFTVTYTEDGKEYILPKYFDNSVTPTVPKYCYYTYPDDKSLRIYFSSLPKTFRPAFNTKLTIEYFTTKGTKGNFRYDSDVPALFRFNDTKLDNIPNLAVVITDAQGGADKPSLLDIKRELINNAQIRDNYITENDIRIYFKQLMSKQVVYGSTIDVVRRRDDVLKRMFTAYLLMRDRTGNIVPTNTINLSIPATYLKTNDWVLSAGSIVIFDKKVQIYRVLEDDDYPDFDNDRIIAYYIPFNLSLKLHPFPRISYSSNTVDVSLPMTFKAVNVFFNRKYKDVLIPNLKIVRNSLIDSNYTISFSLNTNINRNQLHKLKLRGVFVDTKTNEAYGCLDFSLVSEEDLYYSAILQTNDRHDEKGNICITNSLYDIKAGVTGSPMNECYIGGEVAIYISVLYNMDGEDNITKLLYDNYNVMPDLESYTTIVNFSTNDNNHFKPFTNVSNIMHSDMFITKSGMVDIISVPVVNLKYLNSNENNKDFFNTLGKYQVALSDSITKLENNTVLDLKFYNTHGMSQYTNIDRTNLTLGLRIKIQGEFDSDLDKNIRSTIIDFVAHSNNDRILSISNLITKLETTYDKIMFIEFIHINGINIQKVEFNKLDFKTMTNQQFIKYVPEFVNITSKDIDLTYI